MGWGGLGRGWGGVGSLTQAHDDLCSGKSGLQGFPPAPPLRWTLGGCTAGAMATGTLRWPREVRRRQVLTPNRSGEGGKEVDPEPTPPPSPTGGSPGAGPSPPLLFPWSPGWTPGHTHTAGVPGGEARATPTLRGSPGWSTGHTQAPARPGRACSATAGQERESGCFPDSGRRAWRVSRVREEEEEGICVRIRWDGVLQDTGRGRGGAGALS